MGNDYTKICGNIYFHCRKKASHNNPKLKSREGAAELLGISASSLSDYELNKTKVVPVEKIALMAELYNAPEIKSFYCAKECPLGEGKVVSVELEHLDRLTLKFLSNLRSVNEIKDELIDISSDGIVQNYEFTEFRKIIKTIEELYHTIYELKIWTEKYINEA
ncbi:MAG: helix-turn-helix domain-containing protein [Oscillospiraceae bacterium]|jgi:transcriptional regulator with XRE-family HTH domain|nr:helix-turn-helix domain-containing protein [Oscillospiraceae bacterium]